MQRARPRPFLDTNVVFSGLYNSRGTPGTILRLHAEGQLTIVISRQVLEELIVTIREKKPDLLGLLYTFLNNAPPEICPDPTPDEVRCARECVNPDDAPILAAALKSKSDCLVTGNSRDFTPEVAECAGVLIFSPAGYVASLT